MLNREAAISTAAYHARRRGVTQVVWSTPWSGDKSQKFYWFAPLNSPLPEKGATLEYITH